MMPLRDFRSPARHPLSLLLTTPPWCALNHALIHSRQQFPPHLLHRFNHYPRNPLQRKPSDSITPTDWLNQTN